MKAHAAPKIDSMFLNCVDGHISGLKFNFYLVSFNKSYTWRFIVSL